MDMCLYVVCVCIVLMFMCVCVCVCVCVCAYRSIPDFHEILTAPAYKILNRWFESEPLTV